jgi:hypothetical protein
MKTLHFPITIVDDFFDYPDEVREFASQQEYFLDVDNRWPGKRTKSLNEINILLFNDVINKAISLFFNFKKTNISWSASVFFQKVDSKYQEGWVHTDDNICTGIVYLSKSKNKCGTTIYRPIDPINAKIKNIDKKSEGFNNTNLLEQNKNYLLDNNKQFRPTVTIQEEYNRLVLFDGHLFHGANNFYGNEDDSSRLTLVFFINQIHIHEADAIFPIPRIKNYLG